MNREKKAIFAGTFDPIHSGHVDLILRAKKDFPLLKVIVANNEDKKCSSSFTARLKSVTKTLERTGVEVIGLKEGLVANYAREEKIKYLVRGYRNNDDLKYETEMAEINKAINSSVETVFYKSRRKYKHVSSSKIRKQNI